MLLADAFGVRDWESLYGPPASYYGLARDGKISVGLYTEGARLWKIGISTEEPVPYESVSIECSPRGWLVTVNSEGVEVLGLFVARALCFLGWEDPIVEAPWSAVSELPEVSAHEKVELPLLRRELEETLV